MPRSRRRVVVALVLVLGVLATAGFASAAALNVGGASLGTYRAAHPCPGTLQATTPTAITPVQTVTVTPPAACAGREIAVAVSDGAVVRHGTALADDPSVTVTLDGTYTPWTVVAVSATVDGWASPVSWTYTPSAHPCPGAVLAVRAAEPTGANHKAVEVTVPAACTGATIRVTLTDRWGTLQADVTFPNVTPGVRTASVRPYKADEITTVTGTANGFAVTTTWAVP